MKKQKQNKRNLRFYVKKHKGATALYVLCYVLAYAFIISSIFLLAEFLVRVTSGDFDSAIIYLCLAMACKIGDMLMFAAGQLVFDRLMSGISAEIKVDLVNRVFLISSKTFSDKSSGLFLQRINRDPHETFMNLDRLVEHVSRITTSFVTIVYIAVMNIFIGLIMIAGYLGAILFDYFKNKQYAKNSRAEKEASEAAIELTSEIIRSERDIKSLSLENKLGKTARESFDNYAAKYRKMRINNTYFWSSRSVFMHIVSFVMLLFGVFWVKDYTLSLAAFLFIYSNHIMFYDTAWSFGDFMERITSVKVSSARMFEIFNDSKFPTEKFGSIEADLRGNIEFDKVKFGYVEDAEQTEDVKKELFANLTFKIPADKTVAFVGKSGSGKTTILNLIAKLYDADGGEILLDGINMNKLSKSSIRKNISLVNQFPYIFNTTIKENLLMANEKCCDDEIIKACKSASFHDFVQELANGYNTRVGEGGLKLSGGQRQRLAIARALLRKSKIILFDESTSSLDNTTQEEIKASIGKLGGEHTVVIVAHRLSTVKNADIIYFVDNGEVKDSGTFKELMKTNANFAKLFQLEQT